MKPENSGSRVSKCAFLLCLVVINVTLLAFLSFSLSLLEPLVDGKRGDDGLNCSWQAGLS